VLERYFARCTTVIVREGGRSSTLRRSGQIPEAAAYWIPRLRGV
jgi:hypothetical protein